VEKKSESRAPAKSSTPKSKKIQIKQKNLSGGESEGRRRDPSDLDAGLLQKKKVLLGTEHTFFFEFTIQKIRVRP
jgi:hypothetical protein